MLYGLVPKSQRNKPSSLFKLPAMKVEQSLAVSFALCILELSRLTRIKEAVKNTTTRVGTLIVATIYLQLIQNRYMFRSFTVLQCSHQHCVHTTRCQRCGSRRIPLAAPVVLIVRMERSTAWRISGTVLKRMPRSGSFILHNAGDYIEGQ